MTKTAKTVTNIPKSPHISSPKSVTNINVTPEFIKYSVWAINLGNFHGTVQDKSQISCLKKQFWNSIKFTQRYLIVRLMANSLGPIVLTLVCPSQILTDERSLLFWSFVWWILTMCSILIYLKQIFETNFYWIDTMKLNRIHLRESCRVNQNFIRIMFLLLKDIFVICKVGRVFPMVQIPHGAV